MSYHAQHPSAHKSYVFSFRSLSYMMHLLVSRICLSAAYSFQCHTGFFGYLVSDIGEHSRASTETKCTVESCPVQWPHISG